MFKKKMERLAKQIVIASDNTISYNAAIKRAETYYQLKKKYPIKFLGEHLNLDNIARIMVRGMKNSL